MPPVKAKDMPCGRFLLFRPIMERRSDMVERLGRYGTALVIIKHPINGTGETGEAICVEVRRKLSGHRGPVCFFHDATDMTNADHAYAECFRVLDHEFSDRDVTFVCAIPSLVPRIMALTVIKPSSRRWEVFRTRDEAVEYLGSLGATHSETNEPVGMNVTVRNIKSPKAA